eukprot:scaffold5818_cov84-Cylindrotheca_fusiformis.AAC.4
MWHADEPEKAGQQLASLIRHWDGNDVGEFLTRMYLGEIIMNDDNDNDTSSKRKTRKMMITYHPANVQSPQWMGLEESGLQYLTLFLLEALPTKTLLPMEITRFANYFLLRQHKWPIPITITNDDDPTTTKKIQFETGSFISHAADLAKVYGYIRRERLGDFTVNDVLTMMVTTTTTTTTIEDDDDDDDDKVDSNKDRFLVQLGTFFVNLGIQLTSMEKIMIVEGMAIHGYSPGLIARFISSSLEEISEEDRRVSLERSKSLPEAEHALELLLQKKKKTDVNDNGDDDDVVEQEEEIPMPDIAATTTTATTTAEDSSHYSMELFLNDDEFESRWLPEELLKEKEEEDHHHHQQPM